MTNRYLANSTPHDDYSDEHEFCVMDTLPSPWVVCWCNSEKLAKMIAHALNALSSPLTIIYIAEGPDDDPLPDYVFEYGGNQ